MNIFIAAISIIVGIVLAEIIFNLFSSDWVHVRMNQLRKLPSTFLDTHSDDARQALILKTGSMTLEFSLMALLVIAMLSIIAYFPIWLFKWNYSKIFFYLLTLSVAIPPWIIFRKNFDFAIKNNGYGTLSRCLHWLALEPNIIRHISFEIEKLFFLPTESLVAKNKSEDSFVPSDGPVYICGLARSGTTILLQILDEIEVFRSQTYRDMPFVLAPNLWGKLTRRFRIPALAAERSHGDNVMIDFNSPEGFEEVFWRTFSKTSLDNECFSAEEPTLEALENFSDFRSLIANPKCSSKNDIVYRYLSKNNNNLFRLKALSLDQTATILLVYRDPISTARSLHRQHLLFSALQTSDSFTRRYMGWLAHYEFGIDHLPFRFAIAQMDPSLKPNSPNYWLSYWNAVYLHVLAQTESRFYLINHDTLRNEPESMLNLIFSAIGLETNAKPLAEKIRPQLLEISDPDEFDIELLNRAKTTYNALRSCPKNITLGIN